MKRATPREQSFGGPNPRWRGGGRGGGGRGLGGMMPYGDYGGELVGQSNRALCGQVKG